MPNIQVVLRALLMVAASTAVATGAGRSGDGAPLYQRAAAAYRAGQPEAAVTAVRQALQRRLSFPTVEKALLEQTPMPVLTTMRDVARGNAAYALVLAEHGKKSAALQLCDLTHAMAGQLLDDNTGILSVTLTAIALDRIGGKGRTAALKAAGDSAGARTALAREQAMTEFVESQVKPSQQEISAALDQLANQAAARGGPLDPQLAAVYAPKERKIASEITARWRDGPGR